jgi:hypothetical protein
MLTAEEIRQRNEVNYDALMQVGAIDFNKIVRVVCRGRRADASMYRRKEPEGVHSSIITHLNRVGWWPSEREDAGDLTSRAARPSLQDPYSYANAARMKKHVVVLVRRALRGYDVPPDVREAVELGGWSKEALVYIRDYSHLEDGDLRICLVSRCTNYVVVPGLLTCRDHTDMETLEELADRRGNRSDLLAPR